MVQVELQASATHWNPSAHWTD